MHVIPLKVLTAFIAGAAAMLVLSFTLYRRSYYSQEAMVDAGMVAEKPNTRSRVVTAGIL